MEMAKTNKIPAGDFSSWLVLIRKSLNDDSPMEVACGECNACCISSYFIHIKPEETQTIARISKKLLFPAPGFPKGNMLMGYDVNGRCPMQINNQCSIYEYRPVTCRNYDCRIFTAAGIMAGDVDKELISQRVREWEFSYPSQKDNDEHLAVQNAARFIFENIKDLPADIAPANESQLAILAIKGYKVFSDKKNTNQDIISIEQKNDIIKKILKELETFES